MDVIWMYIEIIVVCVCERCIVVVVFFFAKQLWILNI